jgi:hypothetical protein
MNYALIRDRIYTLLANVQGIGKVYNFPRYSADWKTYLDRFKVKVNDKAIISVVFFSRYASQEQESPLGGRSENSELTSVDRIETWNITLIYGYDDDEEQPSEYDFQELLDRIQEKFRFEDFLGMSGTVTKSWPIQVVSSGLFMFGDVLCHRADMTLKLQQ